MCLSFFAMATHVFLNEVPGAHLAPPVPMPVAALLCKLAVERGVEQAALLQMAGLRMDALDDPEALLAAPDYAALIYHALRMTGDPCFGIELGMHVPPTLFGFLGLALICADTLHEALEVGVRFSPLGSRFMAISPDWRDDGVVLTFTEKMPLGFAHQFAVESTIAAWLNCAQHLGGHRVQEGHLQHAHISLTWPRPAAFVRYEKCLPRTSFECKANQLFIPHQLLATRLTMAQPLAARQARAQCEQELAKVHLSSESFSAAVADALHLSDDGFPSLPQVAERMNLSPRTLARRLERQGVNFRDVVNERRRLEALNLLRSSSMRIDDIALRLGYLNPANFTRAFKRWTGETPSAYRQRFQLVSSGD
ncbi:hypothetical protein JY96_06035 [Aquabacterium sp. NJ1]|nr:hypothetical protein JY96_06035 [Aquabacterium sp. NJ1]